MSHIIPFNTLCSTVRVNERRLVSSKQCNILDMLKSKKLSAYFGRVFKFLASRLCFHIPREGLYEFFFLPFKKQSDVPDSPRIRSLVCLTQIRSQSKLNIERGGAPFPASDGVC